jgi:hypothetical protein
VQACVVRQPLLQPSQQVSFDDTHGAAVPPPKVPDGSTLPRHTPLPSETQAPGEIEIVLYWVVGEELQPEYRRIPAPQAVGTTALELLLAGPQQPGISTALPTPEEVQSYPGRQPDWGDRVRLLGLTIEDGVATANFSQEMRAYGGRSARVQMIRAQITQTLLQFPTVQEVQFTLQGGGAGVVDTQGPPPVTTAGMQIHQGTVGGFIERVSAEQALRKGDSLRVCLLRAEQGDQPLQGADELLCKPLAFRQYPVIIAPWQQVARITRFGTLQRSALLVTIPRLVYLLSLGESRFKRCHIERDGHHWLPLETGRITVQQMIGIRQRVAQVMHQLTQVGTRLCIG